jgi:hypothetical protein
MDLEHYAIQKSSSPATWGGETNAVIHFGLVVGPFTNVYMSKRRPGGALSTHKSLCACK